MHAVLIGAILLFAFAATGGAQTYAENIPANHAAIRYVDAPTNNRVARLIRDGLQLQFRAGGRDFLPDVLAALGVPIDSQALVFSKTSFQASKISPRNPRAIYFNDDVAVGWVRGGAGIELAALDPTQGVIFYTLDLAESGKPQIVRRQECLHCHHGAATLGVPGIFVGSVYPSGSGMPSRDAAIITDHSTPFADRWGGWYVNARKGQQEDRANAVAADPSEPRLLLTSGKRNLPDLTREFSAGGYLAPVSDIVALMTFEHQTKMTNLLIRAGWEWRTAGRTDIRPLIDYMLFADEARLPEPVQGVSAFTRTFAERGPFDAQRRSLRQFDLETRLFRYPLSYMIYSEAFDALPDPVRERIYRRLYDVLTGTDRKYAYLEAATRNVIVGILRDTKRGLPAYWKATEN